MKSFLNRFSWSFTFNSRIIRVYFNIFM